MKSWDLYKSRLPDFNMRLEMVLDTLGITDTAKGLVIDHACI